MEQENRIGGFWDKSKHFVIFFSENGNRFALQHDIKFVNWEK